MTHILCENLKKYRLAQNLTQEQVADVLGVNAQTVSRWECGTTLPDVLTLPVLARLYAVTVDDFYKKNTVAYAHYAQRLAAVYEKTRDPADFLQALNEFKKRMQTHELTVADQWEIAMLYYFCLKDCKEKAMYWFDKILADGVRDDPHSFYRACSCRMSLLFAIGQGDRAVAQQREYLEQNKKDPRAWDLLIEAYIDAEQYEEAYALFLQAHEQFPEDWILCIHGGDICLKLKKYDDAMHLYDRAGEIGTFFCDEKYCKASLFEERGDHENARRMYLEIAHTLRQRGYDVEADMAKAEADRLAAMHEN